MNKETAMNAIKLLDRVEVKGHKEREVMNMVCSSLLEIVNKEKATPEEVNGETDAK